MGCYQILVSVRPSFPPLLFALRPPHSPTNQGESVSSETSNGYVHEAEGAWQAFDEEADTQSTQSTHMDVTTDPQSQGSLLLSHSEALAGTLKHTTPSRAPD